MRQPTSGPQPEETLVELTLLPLYLASWEERGVEGAARKGMLF